MSQWQVVEKDSFGTDWHQVRYEAYALERFANKDKALGAAKDYLTHLNCDNALTKDEKRGAAEGYMMTEEGCFLGLLDGKPWYLDYQKDITQKDENGDIQVIHRRGDPVKDHNYYELEGKTEVSVRIVPGT